MKRALNPGGRVDSGEATIFVGGPGQVSFVGKKCRVPEYGV